MAKRLKTERLNRNRKDALRVEALEQRNLLAAIIGGGVEVGSDILHSNGNVYDQVLMTGASVTVTADPGQVTRISFLDLDGDIVQAEFSGKGTLTVTLENFGGPAEAANYNQPGVEYVSGLASFKIDGSDATTNFSLFSVGPANAVNQSLFDGGLTGGNNVANVARLLIVHDLNNPGGFTNFGGIRAGNAVFADSIGTVGISAANVNVQDVVVVGDIVATDSGVPHLRFGGNSQFGTVTVAGGDLLQPNAQFIVSSGFSSANFVSGTTSAGGVLFAQTFQGTFTSAVTTQTFETATTIDITGKSQAEIDGLFLGRVFSNDITVIGDLSAINSISAQEFRGNVTFLGTIEGNITVTDDIKGALIFAKDVGAITVSAQNLADVVTIDGANFGGTLRSQNIGNITIDGNFTGLATTDFFTVANGGTTLGFDAGEGKIGDVTIGGNLSGSFVGILGIGDVEVGGNVTGSGGSASSVFYTSSGAAGDAFLGNIGTVTVEGDVNITATNFLNIANNGTFGAIAVNGGGSVNTGGTVNFGSINVGSVGLNNSALGSISIADANARNIIVGGITVGGAATGLLGDITISGDNHTSGSITLGPINLGTAVSLGNVTLSDAGNQTLGAITAKNVGDLNVTANKGTIGVGAISANDGVTTGPETIGNITLNAGTGTVNLGAVSTATFGSGHNSVIGNITLTGGTVNVGGNILTSTLGAVSLNGITNITGDITANKALTSLTATANSTITVTGTITSPTSTGDLTFNGTTIFNGLLDSKGTTGNLTFNGTSTFSGGNIQTGSTGAITFNGNTTFNGAGVIVADNGKAGIDIIESVTFNGLVKGMAGATDIQASQIGDITITGHLNQNESLVTNLNVLAQNNGSSVKSNAETVARDGSNIGNYSIGNVLVQSTNTIGVSGAALFAGANSFVALGNVGNIDLIAGGSMNVQNNLFANLGAGVTIAAGVGDNNPHNSKAGIDFDGDGVVGQVSHDTAFSSAEELAGEFSSTSAHVSIGNISVNAASGAANNSINQIGGNPNGTDGLLVLSAVRTIIGNNVIASNINAASESLSGSIGDVMLTNLKQQLTVNGTIAGGNIETDLGDITNKQNAGLIAFAGSSTAHAGTIQGFNHKFDDHADALLIGGTNLNASSNELIVARFDPSVVVVIDEIDISGLNQAALDSFFLNNTFEDNLTIKGDLGVGLSINAAEFQGSVLFKGEIAGTINVTGDVSAFVFESEVHSTALISAANIGFLETDGADFGGTVEAGNIGGILIDGNWTGFATTDIVDDQGTFDLGEGAIGSITVSGNVEGAFVGISGIGNITVDGNITGPGVNGVYNNTVFYTSGDAGADANVGILTVGGQVNVDGGVNLIFINQEGTYGDVTVAGGGAALGDNYFGEIFVNDLGSNTALGSINLTGAADEVGVGGIILGNDPLATATLGGITIIGNGAMGSTAGIGLLDLGSMVDVGDISISGAEMVGIIEANAGAFGDITVTAVDAGGAPVALIGVDPNDFSALMGGITAATTIGNFTLDATSNGEVHVGDITAGDSIDDITLSGDDVTILGAIDAPTTGDITINTSGNTFTLEGSIEALTGAGDFTVNGASVINGDINLGPMGNLTFDGDLEINGSITVGTFGSINVEGETVIDAAGSFTAGNGTGYVGFEGEATIDGSLDIGNIGGNFFFNDGLSLEGSISAGNVTGGAWTVGDTVIGGSYEVGSTDFLFIADWGNFEVKNGGSFKAGDVTDGIEINYPGGSGTAMISGDFEVGNFDYLQFFDDLTVSATGTFKGGNGDVIFDGVTTIDGDFEVGDTGSLAFDDDITVNGSFTAGDISGDVTFSGTINLEGTITIGDAGDVTFDGVTTIDGGSLVTGTIGKLTFTAAATFSGGNNIVADNIGEILFKGVTTFNDPTAINLAATAGRHVIGDITFENRVIGSSGVDIRASQIGDITIEAALAKGAVLVKDLGIVVRNNVGEAVAMDGSNLADFNIGNITVGSTTGEASLFQGNNYFSALGSLGNITVVGAGAGDDQTEIFANNTSGVAFVAGRGDGNPFSKNAGIDFDGNGTISAGVEENSDFSSSAVVSIGDIRVSAQRQSNGQQDTIDGFGGQNNNNNTYGFHVMSAVKTTVDGEMRVSALAKINANLQGNIGDVLIENNSPKVLSVYGSKTGDNVTSNLATFSGGNPDRSAFIGFSGTNAGTVNTGGTNGGTWVFDTAGDALLIGGNNANSADVRQLIIVRI